MWEALAILLAGTAAGTINTVVGSGHADHLPDAAGPGAARRSRPTSRTTSGWCSAASVRDLGLPARTRRASGRRCSGWPRCRSPAAVVGAAAAAAAAGVGVRDHRPGADRALPGARRRPAPDRGGALAARRERAGSRARRAAGPLAPAGTLLAAGSTAGTSAPRRGCCSSACWARCCDESLQRVNAIKNLLAAIVNGVAAVTFLVVRPEAVDWRGRRADRGRVGARRRRSARGSDGGCRPPVLRGGDRHGRRRRRSCGWWRRRGRVGRGRADAVPGDVCTCGSSPVDDPRVGDYVGLTDVALRSRREPELGLYMAESEKVIERALDAGHRPRSLLLSDRWLEPMADLVARVAATGAPVCVGDAAACWSRSPASTCTAGRSRRCTGRRRCRSPALVAGARRVVVLEDVVDHTNVGAIFRSVGRDRRRRRPGQPAVRRPAVPARRCGSRWARCSRCRGPGSSRGPAGWTALRALRVHGGGAGAGPGRRHARRARGGPAGAAGAGARHRGRRAVRARARRRPT